MSNEEIMQQVTALRDEIGKKQEQIQGLFELLKKNYPIQPGDKVRITQKGNRIWEDRPDKIEEGQCTELEIHYDDTIQPICYPYKANGEVSSRGKIWIHHDTTIEKI